MEVGLPNGFLEPPTLAVAGAGALECMLSTVLGFHSQSFSFSSIHQMPKKEISPRLS